MLNLPLNHTDAMDEVIYQYARQHRGCMPGVIVSVDSPAGSTVTVKPAIYESIIGADGTRQDVALPILVTVPIAVFGAGGFAMTFPVAANDECLLIFQDMCTNAAWQNGGSNNLQMDKRRHDISDAICIPLTWTKPSLLANTSASSAQLRSTDGSTVIDVANGKITVTAGTEVQVVSPLVSMGASGSTPQTLMTHAFLNYFTATVIPALAAHSITVAAPPANSITTNVEGS